MAKQILTPEREMAEVIKAAGFPAYKPQHQFHPMRKWAFDFAWPDIKLALEVEGGTWVGGRHVTGAGFEQDCIKYAEALTMGWTVLRVTTKMVRDGSAERYLKGLFGESIKQSIRSHPGRTLLGKDRSYWFGP